MSSPMPIQLRVIAAGALLLLPAQLFSQGDHDHHAGKPPERLGQVVFPTTCNAKAQFKFERGLALLHSFWYEEAGNSFRAVIAADSNCAMGYWGQAMSTLHPLWTPPSPKESETALAAAERAVQLARAGSREADYAGGIATYYRGHTATDHRSRLIAYQAAMEKVAQRHPKDDEAQIFNALALIAVGQLEADDTTYSRQRRAATILEPLFRKHPEHPGLAHYLIHAYDYPPLADRGIAAAARYSQIAPSVPHALHMPSHIYTQVGQWDHSIESNLRSAQAARTFEQKQHMGFWDQHGHALDYLVYAYLQQGRDAEARRIVDQVKGVGSVFPANSLINDYALAAIPARYALERGQWREAESLAVRAAPSWPAAEALTHFARAIGAARGHDSAVARTEIDNLRMITGALAKAGGPQTYWSKQVEIQRLAASAWLARELGDTAEALRLAASAADLEDITAKPPVTPGAVLPARELYGDLLLETGRAAEAARAYQASLRRQPNRARSLLGAARAAQGAGDRTAALRSYHQLLRLMEKADRARPELTEARKAVALSP
jgi:tetratricopeptide (TPR) repeat protein